MRVTPCLTISAGALRGSSFTGQLFLVSSLILLKHIKCFKVNFNPSTELVQELNCHVFVKWGKDVSTILSTFNHRVFLTGENYHIYECNRKTSFYSKSKKRKIFFKSSIIKFKFYLTSKELFRINCWTQGSSFGQGQVQVLFWSLRKGQSTRQIDEMHWEWNEE